MGKKKVVIRWADLKTTGRKAAEIIINDLADAIAINREDYDFLEALRKEFILATYDIEKLQCNIKYPETMASKVND